MSPPQRHTANARAVLRSGPIDGQPYKLIGFGGGCRPIAGIGPKGQGGGGASWSCAGEATEGLLAQVPEDFGGPGALPPRPGGGSGASSGWSFS